MKWNEKKLYSKNNHYLVQNPIIIACHNQFYTSLLYCQQLYHDNNKLEEIYHKYKFYISTSWIHIYVGIFDSSSARSTYDWVWTTVTIYTTKGNVLPYNGSAYNL